MDARRRSMIIGDLAVLLVAFIWGATNVVIRDALDGITPFWFCFLRFVVASAALMLLFGRRAFAMTRRAKVRGMLTGVVFSLAYLSGAVGLLYTTAGNQSFIISMSVVFVPLCVWFFTKKFPGRHVMTSVALCLAGLCGLMLDGNFRINPGDALSAFAMLCVTGYILLVEKFAAGEDACGLSCWQAVGTMICSALFALAFEPMPAEIGRAAWLAVIYAGTIGFALTLVLQTAAQKVTSPTHVAILLSTSGIFGSLLGVVFIGEPMTWRIFIASALIFAGVTTVEAVPALKKKK